LSKRPVAVDDLFRIEFLGQVEVSPDGKRVAYVVTTTDLDKDGYRSAIYLLDVASGESCRFTSGSHRDQGPRWSPDGSRLAFLSNRSGKNQIWVIPADGGEAQQLTKLAAGVSEHTWSPDGGFLAFVSKVKPGEEPAEEGQEDKDKRKQASDVRVINRIKYKMNGVGFVGDARSQVFVIAAAGGKPRQITAGDFDHEGPDWSPDGKHLAFAANRTEEEDYTSVRDIWTVSAVAGEPAQATRSFGPAGNPSWTADGKTILFISHDQAYEGSTHPAIWSVPAGGGDAVRLTDPDLPIGTGVTADMTPGPTGDSFVIAGEHIYFRSVARGESHVYRTPFLGGPAEQVTPGARNILSHSVSDDGSVVAYAAGDGVDPAQVCVLADGQERILTKLNAKLLSELEVMPPEPYTYTSGDGTECQGWIIKPPGFRPGNKYPAILEIHGGPHAMFGFGFFHEFQYLAAHGYVVVYTNPRGSQGYGQAFTTAVRHDWGGVDYQDVMAGLDAAIAKGFIDPSRLGVTGGSYGGYMTCWIVSRTHRFRAACMQRALTNWHSFYGTSDIGPRFAESQVPGNPWDNHEKLFAHSPFHYVQNIQTPLLIIHSEEDHRCPIEQAEQVFIALKRLRRTTQFVRFPGENHELSRSGKPKHRRERLERILGWFQKYL
jgi:dipeptidyl aminopeptidase/acylaminoacyl peptidase